jgi:hypothetical protein
MIYQIELPNIKTPNMTTPNYVDELTPPSMDELLLESDKPTSYLSSPLPNEELVIPLTIDKKTVDKYTLTPKRRHRKTKTHKTYKVYKRSKSSKTKSKTKSLRKKSSNSYSIF